MSYKIVVDSCCDLPADLRKDPRIEVVPLVLQVDDFVIIDDDTFDQAMKIIEKVCKSRKQMAASPSPLSGGVSGTFTPYPIEVTVGGATIFVLSVDQFVKL